MRTRNPVKIMSAKWYYKHVTIPAIVIFVLTCIVVFVALCGEIINE